MTAKKVTLADCRALAQKHGCTLDGEKLRSGFPILILDAPEGKIFNESGCHCSAMVFGNGFHYFDPKDYPKMYASIEEIISHGVVICDDPDCDVCEEKE